MVIITCRYCELCLSARRLEGSDDGHAPAGANSEGDLASENSVINIFFNVGSIPTGPTHGEGRLQPHPGDVLKSTPNVRRSPRSGLNLDFFSQFFFT